ncbi:MAG TPA: hypothetical protein VLA72_12645 [Anaerolineales bacterium]|nr:hypothetical protein [Anaerolineales bacterium]
MECSTKTIAAMAAILVQEMQQVGLEGKELRTIETGMREMLRAVGAQALGQYLEEKDAEIREEQVVCSCGQEMEYQFRRGAQILSVFGWTSYRRRYHTCAECHVGQAPLEKRLGIEAGQVTAGLAELLALAGVEVAFEEGTRFLERFLLFRVSDNTLRKEIERFGAL